MSQAEQDPARRRHRRVLAALAWVLIASSCGGKREVAQSDTVGTLTRAMCEYLVKCGSDYEDVDACVNEPDTSCEPEDLEAPIEGAAACASAMRSLSCTGPNSSPTVCELPWRLLAKRAGQADEGEPCDAVTECLSAPSP